MKSLLLTLLASATFALPRSPFEVTKTATNAFEPRDDSTIPVGPPALLATFNIQVDNNSAYDPGAYWFILPLNDYPIYTYNETLATRFTLDAVGNLSTPDGPCQYATNVGNLSFIICNNKQYGTDQQETLVGELTTPHAKSSPLVFPADRNFGFSTIGYERHIYYESVVIANTSLVTAARPWIPYTVHAVNIVY